MISVGFSRNDRGQPVMREKAYPTSEQIYGEWGPGIVDQYRAGGIILLYDGAGTGHEPERRYSHSSGDL